MHRNIVSYHLEESSHARHRKPTAATEVRCSFEERWVNNSSTKWKDYPAKTWVTGTACSRKLACFGSCALVLPSSLLCWNTFVSYCGDSSESRALYKIAWGQHSLLGCIIVPPVWRGQNQCSWSSSVSSLRSKSLITNLKPKLVLFSQEWSYRDIITASITATKSNNIILTFPSDLQLCDTNEDSKKDLYNRRNFFLQFGRRQLVLKLVLLKSHCLFDGLNILKMVRYIKLFKAQRERSVVAAYTLDWCFKVEKASFLDCRRYFCCKTTRLRCFMTDDW